jgi:hypothetical protein
MNVKQMFDVKGFNNIRRFFLKNKKAVGFSEPTALTIQNFKGSFHGRTSAAHHGHHAVNIQYGWVIRYHGNHHFIYDTM